MPFVHDPFAGWLLHPVDLSINKLLALAGRDERCDFVDIRFVHGQVLPLAELAWAAVGKDSGFSSFSLLELLKRCGCPRPEQMARLHLAGPFDLERAKEIRTRALEDAEQFAGARAPEEVGALYYSLAQERFVVPASDQALDAQGIVLHFGCPGGVIPRLTE